MSRLKSQDTVGGLIAIAFGALMWTWLIPGFVDEDTDLQLPVSTMPKFVALALIGLGALQVFNGLKQASQTKPDASPFPMDEALVVSGLLLAIAVAVYAMQFAPFLVVAPLLTAVFVRVYAKTSLWVLAAVSIIGPGVIFVIVRYVFERTLP